MKVTPLSVLAILLVSMFSGMVLVLPQVKPAHAQTWQSNTATGCAGCSTVTSSPFTPSASGDFIVVAVETSRVGTIALNAVTGSLDSMTLAGASVTVNDGTTWGAVEIYYTNVHSITARTYTVTTTMSASHIQVQIYDISAFPFNTVIGYGTLTCTSACSSTLQVTTGVTYSVNDVLFSAVYMASTTTLNLVGQCNGFSPTAPYDGGSPDNYGSNCWISNNSATELFPILAAGNSEPQAEIGVAFGAAIPVTANVVVACTFFQIQCWWYPMFFFGVYTASFMLIGAFGRVSSRGITYLLMTSLTFASMIMVQMGILNVMFPLILTFLTVVYAVRLR